jgi:hypothetical protein
MWLDHVEKIFVVNLIKRTDRLLETAKLLDDYEIPFDIFTAIEKENGAEGLRDTMSVILNEIIINKYQNTLVLEDDVKFLEPKNFFHEIVTRGMEQLPLNYHLMYLGGQATGGFSHFHSTNLLPAIQYFATQSVMYSYQGAKEIMARGMNFPIDNWLVTEIQPDRRCFAIHPILCSQRAGYSDIGKADMDWAPFIEPRHYEKVARIITKP